MCVMETDNLGWTAELWGKWEGGRSVQAKAEPLYFVGMSIYYQLGPKTSVYVALIWGMFLRAICGLPVSAYLRRTRGVSH